jgi:hypothetical protein
MGFRRHGQFKVFKLAEALRIRAGILPKPDGIELSDAALSVSTSRNVGRSQFPSIAVRLFAPLRKGNPSH